MNRRQKAGNLFFSATTFHQNPANVRKKIEQKEMKTRPSKQCEFCNHLLDKYFISQGYQSGPASPGGPSSGQGGDSRTI